MTPPGGHFWEGPAFEAHVQKHCHLGYMETEAVFTLVMHGRFFDVSVKTNIEPNG